MSKIERTMFREYDIRGRVSEKELNEKTAELIGKAFGTFLKRKDIKETVLGYDSREYSPKLAQAFKKGVLATGVDVVEIGMVLTPILYFSQFYLKIKGGAMITASHNPNGWSGFKLGYDFATTQLPEDVKEMYRLISEDDFENGQGKSRKEEGIIEAYKNDLIKRVKIARPLKVVVNAGNGTAGPIAPDILRAAGLEVIEQYCNLDPSFPHHEPNPSLIEAQKALGEKVKEVKADVGFGYDGDGDRLGVCDENGQVVYADKVMILLSRLALEAKPGGKVVFDVKCTQALPEDIKAHGGIPIMWITGHSYIKQKGKEEKAVLAGERSGHIFIREGYYGYDDAIFASLKVAEYLSKENKSFSQIISEFPYYVTSPEIKAPCPDEKKYEVVDKLTQEFIKEYGKDKVITVNGARVKFDDGWGLVRASSNLPELVLIFEAKTKERMEEIKELFRSKINKFPEVSKEWENE